MSNELKYLFTAIFRDGSFIQQTHDDISKIDPNKSQFYDLKQREDDLIEFVLHGKGQTLSVHLGTGKFMCHNDGQQAPIIFTAGDPRNKIPEGTTLRLIFYRQHTHSFNSNNEELGHDIEYFIGWQCTIGGKNIQQTISV